MTQRVVPVSSARAIPLHPFPPDSTFRLIAIHFTNREGTDEHECRIERVKLDR